jgi:hypothetical protein
MSVKLRIYANRRKAKWTTDWAVLRRWGKQL